MQKFPVSFKNNMKPTISFQDSMKLIIEFQLYFHSYKNHVTYSDSQHISYNYIA